MAFSCEWGGNIYGRRLCTWFIPLIIVLTTLKLYRAALSVYFFLLPWSKQYHFLRSHSFRVSSHRRRPIRGFRRTHWRCPLSLLSHWTSSSVALGLAHYLNGVHSRDLSVVCNCLAQIYHPHLDLRNIIEVDSLCTEIVYICGAFVVVIRVTSVVVVVVAAESLASSSRVAVANIWYEWLEKL